ncbi:MAG: hypothetical protein HC769_24985 [Cyanobacteria bacterium CRU_2_1]|nr:hypothetical protein [Cyanobacteria bacterium CRU_2_1]
MIMDKLPHPSAPSLLRMQHLRMVGLLVGVMLVSGGAGWWLSRSDNSGQSIATPVSAVDPIPVTTRSPVSRL